MLPFISKPPAPSSVKIPDAVDHVVAAADVKVKASALVVKLDAAPASNDKLPVASILIVCDVCEIELAPNSILLPGI